MERTQNYKLNTSRFNEMQRFVEFDFCGLRPNHKKRNLVSYKCIFHPAMSQVLSANPVLYLKSILGAQSSHFNLLSQALVAILLQYQSIFSAKNCTYFMGIRNHICTFCVFIVKHIILPLFPIVNTFTPTNLVLPP